MVSQVRSVTVRLNAEVAKYIADIKAAGKATDEAFGSARREIGGVDKDVQSASKSVRGFGQASQQATPGVAGLGGATDDLGDSVKGTERKVKEYTLQMAIAEERTNRFRRSLRDQARAALDAEAGIDQATDAVEENVDRTSASLRRGGRDLDRYSGRLAIWRDVILTLGPSLLPLGAVVIPAVTGLANQLGAAAAAAGVAIFAFQGVGEALGAVNDAAIEPTAENLEEARAAMERLSPAGRDMVTRLREMAPLLQQLRNTAQAEMFPGVIEGLDHLVQLAPQADQIISEIAGTLGDIAAEGGESLASSRWTDFYDFLADEARPTLTDIADTTGSVAHGLSEMWEAFQPLNRDFGDWLSDQADDFDRWAQGLAQTQGFEDFVAYIRENGPRVAEAMGAMGNALVQIVEAAAPVGEAVLPVIEAFADTVATIADSDLGTPILAGAAALAIYNRALQATIALQGAAAATGVFGGGLVGGAGRRGAPAPGRHRAPTAAGRAGILPLLSGGPVGITLAAGTLASMGIGELAAGGSTLATAASAINPFSTFFREQAEGDRQGFSFDEFAGAPVRAIEDAEEMARLAELQERASGTGRDAARAQRELAAALGQTGDSAGLTSDDVETLNQTIAASAEASLGAFSAETQWRQAMEAANEQAKTNNAGIQGSSEAALANRVALEGLAGSWNKLSVETRENEKRQEHAKNQFIDTAVAMGVEKDRARELANEMLNIPNNVSTDVDANDRASAKIRGVQRLIDHYGLTKAAAQALLRDLARGKITNVQQLIDKYGLTRAEARALLDDAATGKLKGILGLLDQADGRVARSQVIITTTHRNVGSPSNTDGRYTGGGVPREDGGLTDNGVLAFADGGFGSNGRYYQREPMIVPGGANILWGEKPTGWEAYISGKPGQRERNIAVLNEAAERLGVRTFANGGSVQAGRPMHRAGGNDQTVTHRFEVFVRGGELDFSRAKAQIQAEMNEIAYDQAEDSWSWRHRVGLIHDDGSGGPKYREMRGKN